MTHRQRISLALFSAGGLALEVTLTRLLSTLYYPPLIFAALSLAVLGMALGAALAALRPTLRESKYIPLYMQLAGAAALILGPAALAIATSGSAVLLVAVMIVPYVFIGLGLTAFFSSAAAQSRLLYAFDLVGAGLGAIAVIPLLNVLGALNGLLAIGAFIILTGIVYRPNRLTSAAAVVGVLVVASNIALGWLALDFSALDADKPIQETLASNGEILATRWDAFARTDLVDPGNGQPYRLYVDGAAASVVPPAVDNDFLMEDIGLFAFATAQPQSVFMIGSGGGLDVWFGQRIGAESITAVEVNPQSVALTRAYASYNNGIYDAPGVRVLVDEGRSVLRREDTTYDLIYLSQVVTLAAERNGYALTENTVFTVEAFQEYWAHLDDEGYLALKLYDEQTLSRALSIVIAMLNQQGLTDQEALHHTIVLLSPATSPPTPLLMIRKTPFTQQESASIGGAAQRIGFASLYLPFLQADPPLDTVESGSNSYQAVIDGSPLDLSAPTDDQPFYYQFERGLPATLANVLAIMGSIVLLGIVLLAGVFWRVRSATFWPIALYFALLGAGFMLVEVVMIQYTRLFIGHPTLSVTTILAALLISGGLGSAFYHRYELLTFDWRVLALIAAAIVVWGIAWQTISASLLGLPTMGRVLVVGLSIAPVGFVMGMPFAAGLRIVGEMHPYYVALAWSINGVMTVAGSIIAVAVAITAGYDMSLTMGVAAYVVCAIVAWGLAHLLNRA